MQTCSIDQAEAVRRYYAAFPALKKGEESPLQYYLPPPAWCRKGQLTEAKMQSVTKHDCQKIKKYQKERRNSYHGPRNRARKPRHHSRSFDSKESLPEWMTHEGEWSMDTADPVRDFIRAIALDEGYGTCENTVAEDAREMPPSVPDWDSLGADWLSADALAPPEPDSLRDDLYAAFEAKFDRSLEALWARDTQATPDDTYQDLPIDFTELLSSPSDRMFDSKPLPAPIEPPYPAIESSFLATEPSFLATEPSSLISLGSGVWAFDSIPSPPLHARLRPLRLASPAPPPPPPPPPELESFALLEGEEIYDTLSTVASTMRSFAVINHSRDTSGFAEVPPRRSGAKVSVSANVIRAVSPSGPREDLLTAARTHFRPIKRAGDAEAARYADGDTFDIRGSLDPVEFARSESGCTYLLNGVKYQEYRASERERGIDYGRMELTHAQSVAMSALPLRFALRQLDAAVQTEPDESPPLEDSTPNVVLETAPVEDEPRDWEELLADIRQAHAAYALNGGGEGEIRVGGGEESRPPDRKRRHSAALRCARHCPHPHARFLPCCAHLRPLTR